MSRSSERVGPSGHRRGPGSGAVLLAVLLALLALLANPDSAAAQAAAGSGGPPKPAAAADRAGGPRPWMQVGRPATEAEIRAWDIDVRADFKGLPPGSGSVAKGQEVWEDKCASCHGVFGESNDVFTPIVGGTTRDDVRTGRVASLRRADYPQRTTLMKVSQVSTLWDYINRAMPWNAPKSLSVEEVYAVVAFLLHLGDVLPADFVLSDRNIAQVQGLLPNRHGKTIYRDLWDLKGKPDVQGDDCVRDCKTGEQPSSVLPDHARNSHGNLAEQHRVIGPLRGADTTRPASAQASRLATVAGTQAAVNQVHVGKGSALKPGADLARDAACLACHSVTRKLVGPSFEEVAERYQGDSQAQEWLTLKVRNGGQGNWGTTPMPANPQLKEEDLRSVVRWILGGAR